MILLLATAFAGDLNFSPDRPGVGDSTATVGTGHVMVEGGLAAVIDDPFAVGTAGIIGRFGVDDGLEMRVRAPDLGVNGGEFGVGSFGLGAKIAGATGERWSVSVVPEVAFDAESELVLGSVGVNAAYSQGDFGLWGHSTASAAGGGVGLLAGGGAAIGFGSAGAYVHAGHTLHGGGSFVGPGGWISLSETLQLDFGVDMNIVADVVVPVVGVGASAGF